VVSEIWGSQISWYLASEDDHIVSPKNRPPLPSISVRVWVDPRARVNLKFLRHHWESNPRPSGLERSASTKFATASCPQIHLFLYKKMSTIVCFKISNFPLLNYILVATIRLKMLFPLIQPILYSFQFSQIYGIQNLEHCQITSELISRSSIIMTLLLGVFYFRSENPVAKWWFAVSFPYKGDGGGTVAKVLCHKSEGRWLDPSWCHWNFSLT